MQISESVFYVCRGTGDDDEHFIFLKIEKPMQKDCPMNFSHQNEKRKVKPKRKGTFSNSCRVI